MVARGRPVRQCPWGRKGLLVVKGPTMYSVSRFGIPRFGRFVTVNLFDQCEPRLFGDPFGCPVSRNGHEFNSSKIERVKGPLTRQTKSPSRGPSIAGPRGRPVPSRRGPSLQVNVLDGHRPEQHAVCHRAKGEGCLGTFCPLRVVLRNPPPCMMLLVGARNTGCPASDFRVLACSGHIGHILFGEPA